MIKKQKKKCERKENWTKKTFEETNKPESDQEGARVTSKRAKKIIKMAGPFAMRESCSYMWEKLPTCVKREIPSADPSNADRS